MSTQIDYARIVLLNRTSRELAAANPVLLAGEAVISDVGTQTPSLRIGDGVRPWSALPRFGAGAQLAAPVRITPGPDGTISLIVEGSTNNVATQIIGGVGNSAFEVMGAPQTDPGWYYATFHPLIDTTPAPGTSNGLDLAAGTNANDTNILLQNAAGTAKFLRIRGDGTGFLGPNEQNSLRWDGQGKFTLGGSAELPRQALSQLSDVQLTDLADGNLLRRDGSRWVNVAPGDFAVTEIVAGTGLTGGTIGPPGGTIGLADTGVMPGDYIRADITVDAQGRITEAHNGGAPSLQELTDVGAMDPEPADGEFLGWEANLHRWLNIHPALAGLADVSIASPAADDVLVFNAVTGKWVNSGLPGGQVIALTTLTDTNITDPQEGEVLKWDSASERWINGAGGGTLASLSDVALATPTAGQVLVYDAANQRWINSNTVAALAVNGMLRNDVAAAGVTFISTAPESNFQVSNTGPAGALMFNSSGLDIGFARIDGATKSLVVSGGGNVTINAPSSGNALTISQPPTPGQFALVIQGSTGPSTVMSVAGLQFNVGNQWVTDGSEIACGAPSGMHVGTMSPTPFTIWTNNQNRLSVAGDGAIFIPGARGATGDYNLYMTTGGELVWRASAARFKTAIRTVQRARAREVISKLRTVSYRSKCEADDPNRTHYGLIAEEVARIDPNLVSYDRDGRASAVQYNDLAMLLLPLMQEICGMDEPEATY